LPSTSGPGPSENRGHEESLGRTLPAPGLPAPGRLRGEEAAGCGHPDGPASRKEPGAAARGRDHRTLRRRQAGKFQYRDLQLPSRDHGGRFQNRPRHAGLQENERRKIGGSDRQDHLPALLLPTIPLLRASSPRRMILCVRPNRSCAALALTASHLPAVPPNLSSVN
jgi:hypothetical protein